MLALKSVAVNSDSSPELIGVGTSLMLHYNRLLANDFHMACVSIVTIGCIVTVKIGIQFITCVRKIANTDY